MVLCHTPFKSPDILDFYKDKYVLVSGLGEMIKLAQLYGYTKAIDITELLALYPSIWPERRTESQIAKLESVKESMLRRLQVSEDYLKKDLAFAAIFLWSDAIKLELNI